MARLSRNQLKTPIEILRPTSSTDGFGGVNAVSSEPIATVFCEWLPVSADVAIRGKVEGMNITSKLYVDIETDIKATDSLRRVGDEQVYTVVTVMPVPQDRKIMVLCEASSS